MDKLLIENIKLLAEFVGMTNRYGNDENMYCLEPIQDELSIDSVWCTVNEMLFHRDWNWLMLVVKKINQTHNDGFIGRDLIYTMSYLLGGGYGFTDYERKPVILTTANLFIRCVEFVKYYNKTVKK